MTSSNIIHKSYALICLVGHKKSHLYDLPPLKGVTLSLTSGGVKLGFPYAWPPRRAMAQGLLVPGRDPRFRWMKTDLFKRLLLDKYPRFWIGFCGRGCTYSPGNEQLAPEKVPEVWKMIFLCHGWDMFPWNLPESSARCLHSWGFSTK